EINGLNNFPDGVSIDPTTKRGYFGPSSSPGEGSSFVNMLHVPLAPAASLGDLVHANMASSALLPRVVHPFGNSRAHPLIPAGQVATASTPPLLDHSYLLNDSLWDSYYFSTLASYTSGTGGGVMPSTTPLKEVLAGVFGGTKPALNSRMVSAVASGDPAELATKVAALSDFNRSRQLSKYVAVNGPFNVNSTSVDAWRAVLSSLRDRTVNGLELTGATGLTVGQKAYANADSTPFVRAGKPLSSSTPPLGLTWAGYRALSDAQITDLAQKIVAEIKLRGVEDSAPSLSLGEFVNRRPGAATHRLAGLLQTAIDKTTINDAAKSADQSKTLTAASISPKRIKGVATEEVLNGESVEGAPTMLTQGDLMAALAPVATVRGDTFKIRCYGEATGTNGTTVVARAWCEAVVQRTPEFVDPTDPPETAINSLTKDANKSFGRRFDIVSFRWLSEKEI
ncbi:MAG: hypothetical protein RLZZ214_1902, partial [Verrucomicrobiota bacterium]